MEILGPVSKRFEEEQLRERLAILPRLTIIAFAAACAARLENTTQGLSTNPGLKVLLSNTVDAVTTFLAIGTPFDISVAEEELLAAMPHEDANPDFPSAVAEDAAAAVVFALRMLRDGDPQNAVWAARRAYDTADRAVLSTLNVGEVGDSEEVYILQHPIVQTELQRQSRDLDAVSGIEGDAPAELVAVIVRARSENIRRPVFLAL